MKRVICSSFLSFLFVFGWAQADETQQSFDFIKPFEVAPLTSPVDVKNAKAGHLIYSRPIFHMRSAVIDEDVSFSTPNHEVSVNAGTRLAGVVVKRVTGDRPSADSMFGKDPEIEKLLEQGYKRNSPEVKSVRAKRVQAFIALAQSDQLHVISEASLEGAPWAYCGDVPTRYKKTGKDGKSTYCLQDKDNDGAFESAYFVNMKPLQTIAADSGVALDTSSFQAPYSLAGKSEMGKTAVAYVEKKGKKYSLLFGMSDNPKKKIKKKEFSLFPDQRHPLAFKPNAAADVFGDAVTISLTKKRRLNVSVEPTSDSIAFARSFGPLEFQTASEQ